MKRLLWVAPYLGLLLSGCNTTIQVASGKEFSDYQKSIKPYLQHWEKPGWTVEGRRGDSAECGAGNTDHVGFNNQARLKAARLPGETESQTETRLRQEWHACMRGKGYHWIETPK